MKNINIFSSRIGQNYCAGKKILLYLIFIYCFLIPLCALAQSRIIDSTGEAYFFHNNDYPKDGKVFWGDKNALTNGIAHDDINWFITALGTNYIGRSNGDWCITKIPVRYDIANPLAFKSVRKSDVPVLNLMGYGHAGDLDHFKYKTKDYLIVPFERASAEHGPAIAIFNCSNLSFVDYACVPGIRDGIGWCAVSPIDGCLYTSNDDADSIFKYHINWDAVELHHRIDLLFLQAFELHDINGKAVQFHNAQGGEFTSSGNLLYMNSGVISACAWLYV